MSDNEKSQVDVDFTWGVSIPMRDGVRLNANIYRPPQGDPLPVIFNLTPYTAERGHEIAVYFARRGYAYVVVDSRGRGSSQGKFEPLVNESQDGHDIVNWISAQPWCDDSVAMWGGSYMGGDQWLTLKSFPPQLKTIVPTASVGPGVDVPYFKNIFRPFEIQWLTLTSGKTLNFNILGDSSYWLPKFREMFLNHLPFSQLDKVVGNISTVFQEWIKYPTPLGYWDRIMLTPEDYERIEIPILTITGHYDDDQPGAMNYYRQHMQWGSSDVTDRHYLVIGPWDHGGTRQPKTRVGGLAFDEASLVDINGLHKGWYDWILKDGAKPDFLEDRVAYYVMGAEQWKYATTLEAVTKSTKRLYLNSQDGMANDVFHSGILTEEAPSESQPDTYIYDPLDVRPADLEREEIEEYLTDQRYALNLFGNGLVYHSAPFEEKIELSGFLKFVCWMSIDVPDTDFKVTVSEITPDGGQVLLAFDLIRARYRDSLMEEKLVEPGEIIRYVFDTFTFFSRQLAKDSRLRLVISCPNTIHLQKNYNSGGVVVEETAADARTAHVNVHHDGNHTSYLELPIGTDAT